MPPKNFMVYLYQDNNLHINQRKLGVNKFIQDIITNDELCKSKSIMSFLTDDDDRYEKFKNETKEMIDLDP